jgi:hypothetical protein
LAKATSPIRSGNKADFDPNKHKLNKAQLQKLNDDLADNKALKDAMDGKPELVDAWKKVSDFDSPSKKWIRTQVPLLEKMIKFPKDVQDRVVNYYKRHNSNSDVNTYPSTSSTGQKYDAFGHLDFTKDVPVTVDGKRAIYKPENGIKGSADLTEARTWALKPISEGGGGFNPSNFQKIPNSTKIKIKNADGNWIECTWHHHQDGKTLMPVPSSVHSRANAAHIGGVQVKNDEIIGFF